MERLGVAQGCAHGLDTGAANVVEGVLLGERPAGCLRVGAECERLGVLGVELLDNLCPEHACGAHLGNFHEEVHADCPEERQTRSKCVDVHTGVNTGAEVFETVGESVSQLDVTGGAGFLHVVAGDGNRVEFGHVLRGVLEDVGDDAHREFRGIDICVAHHEFLEDVVLDGTGHFLKLGSLFEASVDVEGEHGKNGAVHGHRNRHFVQGDAIEQYLHVLD